MNDKVTSHYIIQKCDTNIFLYSVPTWKLMIDSLHIPQYLYRIFHASVAQSIDLTMTRNNIMMVHSCLFEVMLTPVSWLYVTTMKQTDCHVVYLLRLMDTIRRVHSEQNHLLNNLNDYIGYSDNLPVSGEMEGLYPGISYWCILSLLSMNRVKESLLLWSKTSITLLLMVGIEVNG